MKLLVVNNISSGYGDGAIYDYLRLLVGDGDEVVMRCTDGSTPVKDLLDDVREFDLVVASGGDGTVSSVAYAIANSGVPILPFPAGTANLLASNLKSPIEPFALARMTRDMRTLDFDLGKIEADGQTYGFCIMAGAGYDATIMEDAQGAKKFLGPMAYFQAAFANPLPQKSKIRLIVDDAEVETEGLGIIIANFSRIQMDIPLMHDTDARDGSLDVAVLKSENAVGLIPAFVAGFLDRDGEFPNRTDSIEVYRGKEIEAYADPAFKIQYDGEVPGAETPFKAKSLALAARFVVSEEGYESFSSQS